MEKDEKRRDAEPEGPAEAEVAGETPESETPAGQRPASADGPPRGERRPYGLIAAISAGAVVLGAALFVAGFLTHSLLDDDANLSPVEDRLVALEERTSQIQEALSGASSGSDDSGGGGGTSPSAAVSSEANDDPVWGPEDAPVVMVEFSDFQCPYCHRFATETLPQIRQTYGDKVRFIYRDFPLSSIHPQAEKAAEAGQCAQEQGKFWELHDLMFENQGALMVDDLKGYAQEAGLDAATFSDCLDSGKTAQEIQRDYQDGQVAGVTGTPGFLVNGVLVVGAQPFSVFQQVLDQLLAAGGG
jgi:protein-disulfide isomerase